MYHNDNEDDDGGGDDDDDDMFQNINISVSTTAIYGIELKHH